MFGLKNIQVPFLYEFNVIIRHQKQKRQREIISNFCRTKETHEGVGKSFHDWWGLGVTVVVKNTKATSENGWLKTEA